MRPAYGSGEDWNTGSDADTEDQVDNLSNAEKVRMGRLGRQKLVGSF